MTGKVTTHLGSEASGGGVLGGQRLLQGLFCDFENYRRGQELICPFPSSVDEEQKC